MIFILSIIGVVILYKVLFRIFKDEDTFGTPWGTLF
jgi:hypothetical protein